ILSWTDRTNSQYLYQYDEFNRVTDEGGADGSLRFHFTYDEPDPETGLKLHTETNAHGHTTTYTVNERAQITAITDPLGNTSTYERDEYHRLLTETDPLGRTTRHEYDGAGDLIRVTRPNGEQTTATYGAGLSLPEAITEPGGTTWRQAYDALGRRVSATDPLGNVTTFGYDSRGHLSTVTDPAGDTTSLRCDDAGMAVETLDPTGAVTRIERDAFGRPVTVTDPAGQVTRMTWTIEGKPESRTGPDGTVERWTYDGEGNCLAHTDQLGRTTTFEYTHFELLAARTGPDGSRITFTHDSCMQLVAVGNATGQQWTYTYDPAGRVIAETDFHGRALAYRLDAAGQLIEHTDAFGSLTSYDRDELGRVITKEAHGRSTTFGYDQAGNVIRAVNQDADVRRTFDPLGSLLSETVNGRTITFDRDVLGRRTRRTTPSGHVTARSYDTAGRLTGLDTPGGTIDFSYDAAGREQQRTFDDRLTLTSHWNSSDLLSAQELRTSQQHVLQRRTYAYREDGSLSGVDDRLTGKRTFELDLAGRVTGVHAADWSEAYAYDLNGNLTSAEWPATAANEPAVGARSYSGTQLTSAGRVRYEYDSAGRMTLRQAVRLSRKPDTWRYTWDSDNRLSEVTTPDGTRWRYRYDPFGRRIAKERLAADGTTVEEVTTFTWDGPVLAEQTTQASYLPGPHTISWDHQDLHPLAQTETITVPIADDQDQARVDQRFFAIVTDLVGTPTELVDPATESIAWQAGSTLWGQTAWPSASTTYTPLRFPGQYFDPETRLNYNHHRYYDPETARYITPDPLGLTPAPNPDTYVHNPHTWSDPLGLSPHANPRPTGPDPNGHIVYRALAKGEDPSVGLTARDPNNLAVRPLSHVAGKKRTPWISLSKNPDIAFDKYNQGNGVVAIDLRRIPYKYTDISDGPFPSSRRHSAYARKDSEVLAWRFIPPEAIVGIW
ncbi:RHS repeat-associated core domain-containing protein, partial [Kitasatospora viridis]